mmetsp:Transcript_43172/g.70102  ORF Transcript_43172/g.70102 Transcript_43172/m.70102 type:complete len:576 (-) Transcript_43172:326-2053(-)
MASTAFSLVVGTFSANANGRQIALNGTFRKCRANERDGLFFQKSLLLQSSAKSSPTFSTTITMASSKEAWQFSKWSPQRLLESVWFFSPLSQTLDKLLGKSTKPNVPAGKRSTRTILVAGATGGVGKRVVKLLLAKKYRVKVLVRDLEKARAMLGDGVEYYNGDLFNIPDEAMEGVQSVVCCTGTKVGPAEGDTADRAKYYQGIKFYQPVIMENTPENIEYKGVKNLVDTFKSKGDTNDTSSDETESVLLYDFQDADSASAIWGPIDDVVMGGASQSFFTVQKPSTGPSVALFYGNVTTENNGGFCSYRTRNTDQPMDLKNFDGIELRVKGDGQRYKFIVRDEEGWDTIGWSVSFDSVKDQWATVKLPFSKMLPVMRGKTLVNCTLNRSNIRSFQLMLSKFEYDGGLNPKFSTGPFKLELEKVSAYRLSAPKPQFVLCSSAGVTRPGRKDINLEEQPPAVRMNDMLGGIMTWKKAGEDAVRDSGLRYTVIRPCALTEEPSVGNPLKLKVEQGDNMKGQISRDDMADLMVTALESPVLTNVTFEVAQNPSSPSSGQWDDLFSSLQPDMFSKVPTSV